MERKERLHEAYNYLKSKGLAHKQRDLAEKVKTTESNISKALAGDEKVLTDRFLTRFARAYNNIISADWLRFGTGEMVASNSISITQNNEYGDNNIVEGETKKHGICPSNEELMKMIYEMQQKMTAQQNELNDTKQQTNKLLDIVIKLLGK